jgi:rod shape-determining protein MreD
VKPIAHVLFALALAGVQAALLRWFGGGSFSLALPAACVVYVALHGGNVDGSISAAGIGYVMDLMGGSPKGLMTFLAVALFLAVRGTSAAFDVRSRSGFAALSGLGALFLSLGALLLTRYTAPPEAAPGAILLPRILGEAVLTGALSPLVLAGLRRLDALFHREEPGLLR